MDLVFSSVVICAVLVPVAALAALAALRVRRALVTRDRTPLPVLDAEITIALACAIVLVTGLACGRCGVPETLSMLGLGLSLRAIGSMSEKFGCFDGRFPHKNLGKFC